MNCRVHSDQHFAACKAMQRYSMSFGEYAGALTGRAEGRSNKLDGIHGPTPVEQAWAVEPFSVIHYIAASNQKTGLRRCIEVDCKGQFLFQHAGRCFCFNTEAGHPPVVVSVSEELEGPAFHSFRAVRFRGPTTLMK